MKDRNNRLILFQFGSILQIVATKTNYNESAGVWNLEWDAVHICNHFLTHW